MVYSISVSQPQSTLQPRSSFFFFPGTGTSATSACATSQLLADYVRQQKQDLATVRFVTPRHSQTHPLTCLTALNAIRRIKDPE